MNDNSNNSSNTENSSLYPLDWKITDVDVNGKFTHSLSRPSNDLMIRRDEALQLEVPISRRGKYQEPDLSLVDSIDANFYDEIQMSASGYENHEIPVSHKAGVFQGLFLRAIYIDSECDILGEEIIVIEEVGSDDEPDFTIKHVLKKPSDDRLKAFSKVLNDTGKIEPLSGGRAKLITKSNLAQCMGFYAESLLKMEGAKIGEEPFSTEKRDEFIAHVNALIQRAVIAKLVNLLTNSARNVTARLQ